MGDIQVRAPGGFLPDPGNAYILSIYNNDGSGIMGDGAGNLYPAEFTAGGGDEIVMTATGFYCPDLVSSWTYIGGKTFLGLATTVNATIPTYGIDDSFIVEGNMHLYIVEAAEETSAPTTITYNGSTLAELEAGQTATFPQGVKAKTDVSIAFGSKGSITYKGKTTEIEKGKTANLLCSGKKFGTDVVVAVQSMANTYNITTNLSGCSGYSTNPTEIDEGEEIVLRFVPNDGYALPTGIFVSGAEYSWYWSSGELFLRNPTGPVYISISCAATGNTYDITVVNKAGGIVFSTNPTQITEGETVELRFLTDLNSYAIAEGADCSYTYKPFDNDFIGGNLYVTLSNPTGDVTVTIDIGKAPPPEL